MIDLGGHAWLFVSFNPEATSLPSTTQEHAYVSWRTVMLYVCSHNFVSKHLGSHVRMWMYRMLLGLLLHVYVHIFGCICTCSARLARIRNTWATTLTFLM